MSDIFLQQKCYLSLAKPINLSLRKKSVGLFLVPSTLRIYNNN